MEKSKIIGIYKITSPKGRVYIGQSVNVEKRLSQYKNMSQVKSQTKLLRSFIKYGVDNHIFEIIKICEESELNFYERQYQDFYNVIDKGLNCRLTTTDCKSGSLSDNTKKKIGDSNRGKTWSKEQKENKSKIQTGKKCSEETKLKMSNSHKGSENTINFAERSKNQTSGNSPSAKAVICTETGKTWETITDCANDIGIRLKNLSRYLNGSRPNKTTIKYLENGR